MRIAVANESGLDGASLQALESAAATQAGYRLYTQEAIERGIFGAPIFVLDGERFWGQDRLPFVDRALDRMRGTGPG